MKIAIDSFRCFNHVKAVDIRPLTLLVGENSTGKSSFLAGMRLVNELFERGANPSFNKDPYSLGSFKEIAHYRGGKAGRAENFTFSLSTPINLGPTRRSNGSRNRLVDVKITFREVESQPSISFMSFSCDSHKLEITIRDTIKITYQLEGMHDAVTLDHEDWRFLTRDLTNLSALSFFLNDLPIMLYSEARRSSDSNVNRDERAADEFRDILRATMRSFPRQIFAGAPVRTKPTRTYDGIEETPSPEGVHIPYLLARLKAFRPGDWNRLRESLNEFGAASGLFTEIDVRRLRPSPASPFQLAVRIAGPPSNLVDVGYGVSQALPVIVETLQADRRSLFLLQQPEVHLHPRAQAALGSYLGSIAKQKALTIVAETHSDFLIDRVRMDIRDNKGLDPSNVCILFFERTGLDVTIHQLEIDRRGNILNAPSTYREFFLEEQIRSIQ